MIISFPSMSFRPDSMGMYADLQKRRLEQYDTALEARVRQWIEAVLGSPIKGATFREGLMDGVVVCELVNKLVPGAIKKIHRSWILMFRRENFGFFQNACIAVGCKPDETCVFEDVYDDKNMGLFLVNVVALARQVQVKPGYSGPILDDAKAGFVPPAAAGASPKTTGYIPSVAEEAARMAEANRAAGQHTAHGIIMGTGGASAQGPKAGAGYIPSAAEEAARIAEANRAAGRYTQHGIVMNPRENPTNKPR
jgi:hypothetical protein